MRKFLVFPIVFLLVAASSLQAKEEQEEKKDPRIPVELQEAVARTVTQELQRIASEMSDVIEESDMSEEEKQDALNILKEEVLLNNDFAVAIQDQIRSLLSVINEEAGQYMLAAIGFSFGGEWAPFSFRIPLMSFLGKVTAGYDFSAGYMLGFFGQKGEGGMSLRSSPFFSQGPHISKMSNSSRFFRAERGHKYVAVKLFLSHKVNSPYDLRSFNDLNRWYAGIDSKMLPFLKHLHFSVPTENLQFFGHWHIDNSVEKPLPAESSGGDFSDKVSGMGDSLKYFGELAAAEVLPDIMMISWEPDLKRMVGGKNETLEEVLAERLGQVEFVKIQTFSDRAGEGKILFEW